MKLTKRQKIEAEQARYYRENLDDRYQFILCFQGSVSEATYPYISKFGKTLVSHDMYEEFQFICCELGCENPLDV